MRRAGNRLLGRMSAAVVGAIKATTILHLNPRQGEDCVHLFFGTVPR